MSVAIGKRKRTNVPQGRERKSHSSSSTLSEPEDDRYQDIFKRHFESHFAPLKDFSTPSKPNIKDLSKSEGNPDEDSDWSGLSSEDEHPKDVEHKEIMPQTSSHAKFESKKFMV